MQQTITENDCSVKQKASNSMKESLPEMRKKLLNTLLLMRKQLLKKDSTSQKMHGTQLIKS